jgi:hypothetical protein
MNDLSLAADRERQFAPNQQPNLFVLMGVRWKGSQRLDFQDGKRDLFAVIDPRSISRVYVLRRDGVQRVKHQSSL